MPDCEIWYAGWHISCEACGMDSSNASTIGFDTKKEAENQKRKHKSECPAMQDGILK